MKLDVKKQESAGYLLVKTTRSYIPY